VKNHTDNILGLISMLRKYLTRNNPEMVEKIIEKLDLSTNQLTSIVAGFLYLSKFENRTDSEYLQIEAEVLQAAVQLEIQYLLLGRNISLNYNFSCNHLFYSKHILKILFVNLISNSLKFSKPGQAGIVNATLTHTSDELTICVEDNGIGMNIEDENNKVFQLFYRTKQVETEKGFGVGLYVIKKIIDRNNGKIEIASRINEGTKISIRLPLNSNPPAI
ncbi:MAG: sensor histidine kinase, partial [Bacteroidia bacterium]